MFGFLFLHTLERATATAHRRLHQIVGEGEALYLMLRVLMLCKCSCSCSQFVSMLYTFTDDCPPSRRRTSHHLHMAIVRGEVQLPRLSVQEIPDGRNTKFPDQG